MKKTTLQPRSQLSIEYIPLDALRPFPTNPRIHSEKQIHQIARSIRTFGFNVPILVDASLNIIAGHGRVLAAKQLKIAKVPIIRLAHLTEQQKIAFLIADNRLSEVATWNSQLLGEQLKILSEGELDFDLDVTGFEIGEIDICIEGLPNASDTGRDDADNVPPEDGLPSIARPGDLWLLGNHRVACGDARETSDYRKLMGSEKAAMVFTDPPYNVRIDGHATGNGKTRYREFAMASGEMTDREFEDFLRDAFHCAARHSLPGSLHYYCMDWRHLRELMAAGCDVFTELKNLCVWAKDRAGMGSFYRSKHELVFVFRKAGSNSRNNIQLGSMGRYRTNVWEYPAIGTFGKSTSEGDISHLHPTIKPVALIADAILDCTARGDVVLDPFLGSGSTIIASERVGRVCYGLEIDPLFVDTVVRRWQRFSGKEAIHSESGKLFNEMEGQGRAE
jgi:DNA modification methylase